MEKKVPHYSLQEAQSIVARDGVLTFTQTAIVGAAALGLSGQQVCQLVCALTRSGFYKSMTTHTDSRVWQDVYHALCPDGRLAYIKLTLAQGGRVVIQFKEQWYEQRQLCSSASARVRRMRGHWHAGAGCA